MTDLLALLYFIICMLSVNPAVPDPNLANQVFAEYQINGVESAIENLDDYWKENIVQPDPSSPAAIMEDAVTSEDDKGKPISTVIDPTKLDYKKELLNLGFYREDSKDNRLNLRNAVLRFQSSCNMKVNGTWDNACLKALVRILTANDPAYGDAITSPPSEGMWITINKTKRTLTLYEGMNILKKYPVAIGNPSSLTPEGKFTIVSKVIDPYWGGGGYAEPVKGGLPSNPLGHRWMGLSYKTGDDLGIHGNNSPYSIGKNISHGCIRMINSDVEELFEVVPRSAIVWIGSDATLKVWGIEQRDIAAAAPEGR